MAQKTEVKYWTSRSPKKWRLIARNSQGASVEFWAKTKRETLEQFNREYDRRGFKLSFEKYIN